MSRIFISYRREDTGMGVGRLTDALREHFASDQIFQDISSIAPGADFIEALQQALADCAAVLVVIGPKWLSVADRQGRRRLDDSDDWVRQEIVEALGRPGLRVFPLLVDGAEMPAAGDMPEAIRPLARRQAYELTLRHWAKDIAVLVETLKRIPSLITKVPLPEETAAPVGWKDAGRQPEAFPSLPTNARAPETAAVPAESKELCSELEETPPPPARAPLPERSAAPIEQEVAGPQPEVPPQAPVTEVLPNRPTASSSVRKGLAVAGIALAVGFGVWFAARQGSGKVPEPQAVEAPPKSAAPDPAPAKPAPAPKASSATFSGEMVKLPAGCFEMGSPQGEEGRYDGERQHRVCVEAFVLGKTEVTQAQWQSVMGNNPSHFKCADCPVEMVSWNDTMAFVAKLNVGTGQRFRLPTEAEWEYACRGGRPGERYCGGNTLDSVAWFRDNSGDRTHPVRKKQANGFGLHDMSGNVVEWTCSGDDDYSGGERRCANNVDTYIMRGGGWYDHSATRSASRVGLIPSYRDGGLGFRLARTLP